MKGGGSNRLLPSANILRNVVNDKLDLKHQIQFIVNKQPVTGSILGNINTLTIMAM